jgi:osmotically inducible protein OsmC
MSMDRRAGEGARLTRILYTAKAVVEGGRRGHGRTSDGRLDVDLSVPTEMDGDGGPGTNPEQLFALGYAACFQSALLGVARGRKLDASDSTITAQVGIGPTGHGGFGLAVALDLHAPHVARAEAEELMLRAHERCPYSNATRGNIEVTLTVDGVAVAQEQRAGATNLSSLLAPALEPPPRRRRRAALAWEVPSAAAGDEDVEDACDRTRSSAYGSPVRAGGGKQGRIKAHCLSVRSILLMRAGYCIPLLFWNRSKSQRLKSRLSGVRTRTWRDGQH